MNLLAGRIDYRICYLPSSFFSAENYNEVILLLSARNSSTNRQRWISVHHWCTVLGKMRVLSPSPTKASNYSHDLLQVFDWFPCFLSNQFEVFVMVPSFVPTKISISLLTKHPLSCLTKKMRSLIIWITSNRKSMIWHDVRNISFKDWILKPCQRPLRDFLEVSLSGLANQVDR